MEKKGERKGGMENARMEWAVNKYSTTVVLANALVPEKETRNPLALPVVVFRSPA
jgi:hypothetical protein